MVTGKYESNRLLRIVISANTNEDFILEVLNEGVLSFIPAKLTTQELVDRIAKAIRSTIQLGKERRKHVRVQPHPKDNLRFNMTIPNTEHSLTGKILNISLGGALMEIAEKHLTQDNKITRYLSVGDLLVNVQLGLNDRLILTDCRIVIVRGDLVGVKFLNPRGSFMNSLAKYIHQRLT